MPPRRILLSCAVLVALALPAGSTIVPQVSIGDARLRQRQVNEAIASYESALRRKPGDPDILGHLGLALGAANRRSDASLAFGGAASARPNDLRLLNLWGRSLAAEGRYYHPIGNRVVVAQRVNLGALDLCIGILPNDIAARLQTFDVMTGNANINIPDLEIRIAFVAVQQCLLDSLDRLIDIQHLSMLNAVAVGAAKPKDFEFAVLVFSSRYCGNFCSANVKAYNDRHTGVIVLRRSSCAV